MRRRDLLLAAWAPVERSVLVHEHVLVNFTGASYDRAEAYRVALPKLNELLQYGCRRLQECTPNFIGRDPELLRRLSGATGLEIWTNTGLYGAVNHKYVPAYAVQESAAQLAKRWEAEFHSELRPRFIKIGVNNAPLDPIDRKLVEAAALASNSTGLTIASHTGGRGPAALEQLEILSKLRCPAARFVWVHAQNEKDHALHEQVARAGAWVEFDGISERTSDWHLECVQWMQEKGLVNRVLLSQDSGWYRPGEPDGGEYRGYTYIYTDFLPKLSEPARRTLMETNPRKAFG